MCVGGGGGGQACDRQGSELYTATSRDGVILLHRMPILLTLVISLTVLAVSTAEGAFI